MLERLFMMICLTTEIVFEAFCCRHIYLTVSDCIRTRHFYAENRKSFLESVYSPLSRLHSQREGEPSSRTHPRRRLRRFDPQSCASLQNLKYATVNDKHYSRPYSHFSTTSKLKHREFYKLRGIGLLSNSDNV